MVIILIIGGSASQKLAADISRILDETLCPLETRKFPDGERYIRIKGKVDDNAIIVQSTGYPQDENLMELIFILKTLKNMGVDDIKIVIPYFGYARQEKSFNLGEAVSAQIIAELLEFAGASHIISVNLHEDGICDLFKIPTDNISAMPVVADYLGKMLNDPVIIAPDYGALPHAQEIASILKCDYDYLQKTRISANEVKTRPKNMDVAERETVIIDDIISTGGTIVNAAHILAKHKAHKITVACVHPVLVEDALLKIFTAKVADVISTDTLVSPISVISVANLLAQTIKSL